MIGVPDPAVGQRIKAIVVLHSDARGKLSEDEIKTYCRQSLAEYKVPHIVEFRGELPKTDVGCAFVRRETPEEHETACKGAVTDATKRALRQFGDQFGNRLYDKHVRLGLPEATRTGAPKKGAPEMRESLPSRRSPSSERRRQ